MSLSGIHTVRFLVALVRGTPTCLIDLHPRLSEPMAFAHRHVLPVVIAVMGISAVGDLSEFANNNSQPFFFFFYYASC